MKINLFLTIFILLAGTFLQAKTTWNFKEISNGNTVPDISRTQMLKITGTSQQGKGEIFSPAGSYFIGRAKTFSVKQGTFKVCFKIKEYNNWDGILQTHIGFKENGKAKYIGIGFKRISTGIFQAYSIPTTNGSKNIKTSRSAELDDDNFHIITFTYQDGKVKDGKGTSFYIDGKLIGQSDYDSSKCWNKGTFLLGATLNKNHAPAVWFKSFEYDEKIISNTKAVKKKASVNSILKKNLAKNADFEKIRSDNWVKNWSKCETFSLDISTSQTGKNSLRYDNNDPKKYVFPESPLNLTVGKRYQLSGWIKVRDVQGPGTGASIAIEYYNANNKYLGGTYTKGMKGTDSRWTEFTQVTNSIPAGTVRCRLICFVRQGMTGTAWFDAISVVPFYDPFFKGITTDVYRNESASGKVQVKAGVNWESDKGKLSSEAVQLYLTVVNSSGKEIIKSNPVSIKEQVATFSFDSSSLKPGNYRLKCAMKVKGKSLAENISCSFQKLAHKINRKVYIDKYKRLIVNGKAFFPLGTYWSKVNEKELQLYSKSPFNCLMPYERLSEEQMDLINNYRLKTFYSLKDCYYGTRWCPKEIKSIEDADNYIVAKIKKIGKHPALLAWYINDERPVSMLNRLIARQDLIKQHDVNHPTWAVLCKLDNISALLPTYDVIGTDPYPIPDMPANVALDWTSITKNATFNARAAWMVPQIFNWAAYSKVEAERKRFRAPTLLEMRSMAWQCIAGGANGLVFYSWFDMRNLDKLDPFDKRWKDVCIMAAEIKKFIPVLLSVEPVPKYIAEASETVAYRFYVKQGNTYLAIVNSSKKPTSVRFTFKSNFKNAKAMMSSASFKLNENVLKIDLAPLEPKMIKLSK
ncbi:MAG: hypothetical protein WCS73_00400 [Lentisphaeria bacterium]